MDPHELLAEHGIPPDTPVGQALVRLFGAVTDLLTASTALDARVDVVEGRVAVLEGSVCRERRADLGQRG